MQQSALPLVLAALKMLCTPVTCCVPACVILTASKLRGTLMSFKLGSDRRQVATLHYLYIHIHVLHVFLTRRLVC
jgi:hypothetical protein